MVSRSGRVVAVVLAAVVVVLALATAWRTSSIPSASCAVPCAALAEAPDEAPCVSDPACAGHTSSVAFSWVADPAAVAVVTAAVLLATLPRRRARAALPGLLGAGGLYRPPRFSV